MTTPEVQAAVERVTAIIHDGKRETFEAAIHYAYGSNESAKFADDLTTILSALAEANRLLNFHREECARLNDALAASEARRVALEQISRNICDATTQDDAGQWIITGDAEMMLSDLLSALNPQQDGSRDHG